MPDFAVIIPAAGGSTRFGGPRSKLLERIGSKPVLRHSIAAFARRADVKMIVVAATHGPRSVRRHVPTSSFLVACDGGTCRAGSVRNALDRIPAEIEWVAVHDAARPLISQGLIDRTLAAAVAHGGAVAAMPVALTVRQASGPLPAKSEGVIPRDRLWAMQTPQIMRRADLARAFERCTVPLEQITDDVQLLELMGLDVWLVPGEEANLKVTTPTDLIIAQTLWEGRSR
jgi:2-C-methyl-D-erythritol 4-phosphate cytidylyltransferase